MKSEQFADDTPVGTEELARTMRVSRNTVWKWKCDGYRFEFGRMTTAGHCKQWLRSRALEDEPTSVDASRRKLALSQMQ